MSELNFIRVPQGLVPADDEAKEWLAKKKAGTLIAGKFSEPRNGKFHRKLFAALSLGFDSWEPPEGAEYKGVKPAKNRERFRADVLVMAGHYEVVTNLRGETRVQAKSISYKALPTDADFEPVYKACVDVLIRMVLKNYTHEDVENVVMQMLEFGR